MQRHRTDGREIRMNRFLDALTLITLSMFPLAWLYLTYAMLRFVWFVW